MERTKAQRALELARHIQNLAKIAVIPEHEAADLYTKLLKLENRLHKLAENACNREITPEEDKEETRLKAKVAKLLEDILIPQREYFFNADPRGYVIKINEETTKSLRDAGFPIHTDMGGYGILAPEF